MSFISSVSSWFESNVILDRYKTYFIEMFVKFMFESNVILDRYKTIYLLSFCVYPFESNVILDRYKTYPFSIGIINAV